MEQSGVETLLIKPWTTSSENESGYLIRFYKNCMISDLLSKFKKINWIMCENGAVI